jgi:hypothetical protein
MVHATVNPQTRILSSRARSMINRNIKNGKYNDREGANEPAYMAPSTNPEDYSMVSTKMMCHVDRTQSQQWCSICYDFAEILLLCSGCRVGLCTGSETSPNGCVVWAPTLTQDDFVFLCPYCMNPGKQSGKVCIKLPSGKPTTKPTTHSIRSGLQSQTKCLRSGAPYSAMIQPS